MDFDIDTIILHYNSNNLEQYMTNKNKQKLFILVCQSGRLDIALNVFGLISLTESNIIDAFSFSCQNNHLHIAQWIYNYIPNDKKEYLINSLFNGSCEYGYTEMAKWFYTLGANYSTVNHYAFRWSCKNNHLETVKWLATLDNRYSFTANSQNKIDNWNISSQFNEKITLSNLLVWLKILDTGNCSFNNDCLVCSEQLTENVIQLECGHSLCLSCFLILFYKYNNQYCPCRCNIDIKKSQLISNIVD